MTPPLSQHQSEQHLDAFTALLATIRSLASDRPGAGAPSVAEALVRLEDLTIDMIEGLTFSDGLLIDVVATPSLRLLKALTRMPEWDEGLTRHAAAHRVARFPTDGIPFNTADAEYLAFLWDRGFALDRATLEVAQRYLEEESEYLDPIAEACFSEYEHPLLGAMSHCNGALMRMQPGHGLRHLNTLARLLRERSSAARSQLNRQAVRDLRMKDWPTISLHLWLGHDLSRFAKYGSGDAARLLEMSGSRHGQIALRGLEPDVESLAGRAPEAPRFGILPMAAQNDLAGVRP